LYLASYIFRYFRCKQEEIHRDIGRRLRKLGVVTAITLATSLINPYGYQLHVHIYRYLSSRWLMNHIDEFLSPNFHGVAEQCFVLILLITIAALALGRKPPLSQVLVLLFATYSGLYAARSLPVSSLLLTLVVAPLLTQAVREASTNYRLAPGLRAFLSGWEGFGSRMAGLELNLRGHAWPLVALVLGLLLCAHQGRLGAYQSVDRQFMNAHFDGKHFPVQAAEMIAQRGLHEPIFSLDSWGGYLIYRLYPQIRVFVDDRHDLYGEEFLKNYLKAVRLTPDWDSFLSDDGLNNNSKRVNWVLVPAESSLANMLLQTSQWSVVYRDTTAVLFERKAGL
jgi:hypothetical protein